MGFRRRCGLMSTGLYFSAGPRASLRADHTAVGGLRWVVSRHLLPSERGSLFSLHLEPERSKWSDCQDAALKQPGQLSPCFLPRAQKVASVFGSCLVLIFQFALNTQGLRGLPVSFSIQTNHQSDSAAKNQAWARVCMRAPCEASRTLPGMCTHVPCASEPAANVLPGPRDARNESG